MEESGSEPECLSEVFRKWARSNLTGSMKKSGTWNNIANTPAEDVEKIIKSLRQSKLVDPFPVWNEQNRGWWNAATSGNLHDMSCLLKSDPTILDWKNPLDGTALHYLAKIGNLRCLDFLVKHYGANVDIQCKGCTPLHIAVMYSQRLFARSLVQIHHARTDIMDYAGRFPRDLISTPEMKEDLEELLTSGRLADIRRHFEVLKKPHKSSLAHRRPLPHLADGVGGGGGEETLKNANVNTLLLLSTLSRDQEYVNTLVRRLRHVASASAAVLLEEMTGDCKPPRFGAKSRKNGGAGGGGGEGERRFNVFKMPHLPHPARHLSAGAVMAGELWKRATMEIGDKARRRHRQQKTTSTRMRKVSTSTSIFSVVDENKRPKDGERRSFASLEQLTTRLISVRTAEDGEGEGDGRISRHPSNVSESLTKSLSDEYATFDSASSSLSLAGGSGKGGVQRTSSLSSLVACTEDLFSQYFPASSPPITSSPRQ